MAGREPSYDTYVSDTEMVQTDANPKGLRNTLKRLLTSEAELRRRGLAARERALEDFSLAACAKRHLEIYEQARRAHAR